MFWKYKKNKKGFSLVEMLIYTALLSFFMIIVVNAGIIMTGAYARARTAKLLNASSVSILTRLSTEIKKSSEVSAASILNSNPGALVLSQPTDTGIETVEFYILDGRLVLRRAGAVIGTLSPENVTLNNLVFQKITTTNGQAVRLVLTLSANKGGDVRTETFYNTTVLRESY
jgi:Tfp pilus assembly protein FimT